MNRLPLDELPRHSTWATYLLAPSSDPPSDPEEYTGTARYDDIYSYLLGCYREDEADIETFAKDTYSRGREDPDVISTDETLYLATTTELLEQDNTAVRDVLRPALDGNETVADLGCGWGATLGVIAEEYPSVTVVGGECSQYGVELATELHSDRDSISVEQFDFYGEWDLLDGDNVVVFTRGTLTTLGDVESVVDRLAARAANSNVISGIHLEQTGPHPDTVLGLLRQQYASVRNYNTDFLSIVENHQDLTVTHIEYDVIGPNPLHPLTAVRWRPTQ